ncbi:signal transduction histidine kinase [Haloactinospora alba]|uniref:histidine kinase n=1 Tax=Haloactinospora alba TaxID=405555 RepID=A0A543N7E0_9ACTN|nr:sensor histidine kinase [Haloactinospora alba]TQN27723.1 signal transduction histidine kinase [Haloactinospora alba]
MSLRWRITLAIALVSTLVALALSLTVHFAYAYRQAEQARQLQTQRLELALEEYDRTGQPGLRSQLNDPKLPDRLREAASEGGTAAMVTQTPQGAVVWAALSTTGGDTLSLRSSYQPQLDDRASLDRVLLMGAAALIATGTGAGVVIGARLSRRLRHAAAAAARVADGDYSTRVSAAVGGRSRDEAAELAQAVDAMSSALQNRLQAERQVTADIAHELRTPLTGLTTAAELLPEGRSTELVRGRIAVLRDLVEDVLEVARLDTATELPELSDIAVGDFVTRRVATYSSEPEVRVATETVVATDPRRLERVLANLVSNAYNHGRPPVVVEVDGPRVRVRDHGPGFPDEVLAEGPGRFRKGSGGGHGLGLTIAVGQARVLGARLSFTNADADGGAVAVLELPVSEGEDAPGR